MIKEIETISDILEIKFANKDELIADFLLIYNKTNILHETSDIVFFIEQWGAQEIAFINYMREYIKTMNTSWDISEIRLMNKSEYLVL